MSATSEVGTAEDGPEPTGELECKTVLIVEPLPDQQWKLARMFTVGGFRVIGTSGITAAQALLRSCSVDLILVSDEACREALAAGVGGLLNAAPGAKLLIMHEEDQNVSSLPGPHRYIRRPKRVADVVGLGLH